MNYVIKNIRWRVIIDGESLQRKEIPEIPIIALREVIINSFAHARYDGNVMHEIDIYSNRISVINPGSFANEFTPKDFFNRDMKSYLRNQSIADVLYLCKDVETCGHGLKKVYRLCNEANVNISYTNNENDFTMEFSRLDRNENDEMTSGNNDISDGIQSKMKDELSKDEFSVLLFLKTDKHAKKEDIKAQTNFSSRKIDRIIKSLKEKGLLKRTGPNTDVHWEVIK